MGLKNTVLAFDFGGTWLKIAEVDRDGLILWDERVTPVRDYREDMDLVRKVLDRRTAGVVAGAIGSPGPLDFRTGHVMLAANLDWHHVYPGHDLQRYLGVPMAVENDADCAALGEAVYGIGKSVDVMVYYGLGTGVGSGLIVNKRIFHGSLDPEFGHQIIDPQSERSCSAGHRGCLEALIGGGVLLRAYGRVEDVPETEWTETIPTNLGHALANATLFFSPEMIVVGGGVIDHRPDIVGPAVNVARTLINGFVEMPRVEVARLKNEVGILGSAAVAWRKYDDLEQSAPL